MSSASSAPLSDVALAQLLRTHGLRATAQRRAIYGLFAGTANGHLSAEERKAESEVNAERRKVIRDMLYRKDR